MARGIGKALRPAIVALMCGGLLASPLTGGSAAFAAQADPDEWEDLGILSETEYESPTYGFTVEWDDPWLLDEEAVSGDLEGPAGTGESSTNGEYDYLWLYSEDGDAILSFYGYSMESLSFTEAEDAIETNVEYWSGDEYLEDEAQFPDGAALILADSNKDGGTVIIDEADGEYIRIKEARVSDDGESLITIDFVTYPEAFEDTYTSGGEIEIEGNEIFDIIDVDDALEAMDGGSSSNDEDDEETTPDDDENTDEDEDSNNDETMLNFLQGEEGTSNRQDSGDDEEFGILDDGEYESPQFGYSVEWSGAYVLDEESDGGPAGYMDEATDDQVRQDWLYLTDEDGATFASVQGYSLDDYGWDEEESLENWVDWWTSDDYLETFANGAIVIAEELDDEIGAVIILAIDGNGDAYIRYKEVRVIDDAIVVSDFAGYVDMVEDYLPEAIDGIELEGDPYLSVWDEDDVLDAIDDAADEIEELEDAA